MLQTAKIFQDHMVLQRELPITVWGQTDAGALVKAELSGAKGTASAVSEPAGEDGAWRLTLPPQEAAENVTLTLLTEQEQLTFSDVAIGEVWLAGGQSNMEFCMRYEKHKTEALRDCENSRVRFFDVPEVCFDGQLEAFDYSRMAVWRKADEENLEYFSAVGYYFEKDLEKELDVPVGIIGCNWGGTTASAWMDKKTVEKVGPDWIKEFEKNTAKLDMEQYWKDQLTNPANNRGNLFDEFSEMVMPKTPSGEELMQFFQKAMEQAKAAGFDNLQDAMGQMVQPQTVPGCLYEHMVKTIAPYTVRGALWYQGESDDDVPGLNVLYKDMLTALIGDWRKLWGQDFPFLIVQLPGFETWMMQPPHNHYQVIRQCQEEVTKTVKDTWLCSISDVGEQFDIHPKDKRTVGQRLALLARKHIYGEDILADAPEAEEIRREGRQIAITFSNAGAGLSIAGDELAAMQVFAGEKEVALDACTEKDQLLLTLAEDVDGPFTVAFAKTMWYQVNLYNEAGIPAIPFAFDCE